MAKYRQGRLSEEIKKSVSVSEEIKKSVSGFLINGAKDPALTSRIISITGAEVTRDGSYATVYVSPVCLSDEDKDMVYSGVLAGLERAKGAIRGQLSRDIMMRHTPELIFKLDKSQDYGRHIDSLIDSLTYSTDGKEE